MRIFYIFFLGASLWACSSHLTISGSKDPILSNDNSQSELNEFLQPYSDSLKVLMSEKIAYTKVDLIKERPSSNLMKWVANAIFSHQTKNIRLAKPAFCLLNTGGLRSTIGKGDVRVGDIFKLMPFDNTVVWVEFDKSVLNEIEQYLINSGGEPLSNATFDGNKLLFENTGLGDEFILITSDYLYGGGDSMEFMKKGELIKNEGTLIRDILIEEAKYQKLLHNFCE
jgi:2',3'-cyclic-nucleotide 2'-phosphodiesterase (5'-nucleotidase family)